MKKTFFTFIIILFTALKGYCLGIAVTTNSTIVTDNLITQNLSITFDSLGLTTITVNAFDEYIVHQEPPYKTFPISSLFVTCNGTKKQLQYGVPAQIFQTNLLSVASLTQPAYLMVENIMPLPAGLYIANLQFTCTSLILGTRNFNYYLSFTVPPVLEAAILNETTNIKLSEDEVFLKEALIKNIADTQIAIKSNKPWNLYLTTSDMGKVNGKYFALVKAVTNVSGSKKEKIELKPNTRYLLGSGAATILYPATGSYLQTSLTLEHSFQSKGDSYPLAGNTSTMIKYSIEAQ